MDIMENIIRWFIFCLFMTFFAGIEFSSGRNLLGSFSLVVVAIDSYIMFTEINKLKK